jgi:hypothetical protein
MAEASAISGFVFDYDKVANVDNLSKFVSSNEAVSVDRYEVDHGKCKGL